MGRMLGILGGMGPLPSADFVRTLYRLNPAEKEQGMPACVLYSDPSIPDRTEAIVAGDTDEVTARLTAALETLAGMGAEPIVIACVTAHHMLPGVPERLRRKVVSLVELVIEEILRVPGESLLLCTTGTRRARIFDGHPRWREVAEQVIFLSEEDQRELHRQLYCLKGLSPVADCLRWLEALPARYGRNRLVFGCTELHLIHDELAERGEGGREPFGILDPLWIAARDARKLLRDSDDTPLVGA